jgi:hypothetical protein
MYRDYLKCVWREGMNVWVNKERKPAKKVILSEVSGLGPLLKFRPWIIIMS